MAASGASSIKGGNIQMFQHFLKKSGANIILNTSVCIPIAFLTNSAHKIVARCRLNP